MIDKVTFIDVETVPRHAMDKWNPDLDNLDMMFLKKFRNEILSNPKVEQDASDFFFERASLYAEFNQIVAVSIGKMHGDKFFVKSLVGRDEKILLEKVTESIAKAGNSILCAHNGKEFDFPILMRKYMIHGLPIPGMLNVAGKKPWDVTLEDTMQMWSGTQWNYKVSLELLCSIMNIPTPKSDMKGADVAGIYYGMFEVEDDQLPFDKEETALRKIGKYCSEDVIACASIWSRMKGLPIIDPSIIVHT